MSDQPPDLSDPQIAIKLPFSAWCTVLRHLHVGTYIEVAGIVSAIGHQASPQLSAAHQAEQVLAAETVATDTPIDARPH